MVDKIKFMMTQLIKMILQHLVLPVAYCFWCLIYFGKKPELVVFADSNHDTIPPSMVLLHEELEKKGVKLTDAFRDCGKSGQVGSLLYALDFMRLYAQAKVVFICDNFHPVISCSKKKQTTVVQLWHACGAYKKFGYASEDDIPKGYLGHMYKNYDLVTVSSEFCVQPFEDSMRQKPGVVQALGVARTDCYFDEKWVEKCRKEFYEAHPDAKGKKIVLWAPTFRGNAGNPHQIGLEEIKNLQKKLEDVYLIMKVHPHVDSKLHLSNCNLTTENLFPVVDVLITDYSSVLFDFMVFNKPYVLYVPDLREYSETRGFYLDIKTLSPYLAQTESELIEVMNDVLKNDDVSWLKENYQKYLGACDGHVIERLCKRIGL